MLVEMREQWLKSWAVSAFILSLFFYQSAASVTRKLHLQAITTCKDSKNYSMDWGDFTLEPGAKTNDFLFGIRVTVLKQVTDFGIEFNFWKCETESWDSCENFLRGYKVDNICPYLSKKRQFWSPFVESIVPPLVCPIKPAEYKANNVPLFTDYWTFLPVQQRFIRARLLGFDGNEIVSCVDVEVVAFTSILDPLFARGDVLIRSREMDMYRLNQNLLKFYEDGIFTVDTSS